MKNPLWEMKKYEDLVMEGHSIDYQSPEYLKEMMEDGIAILKVRSALTFALRKGMSALSNLKKELVEDYKYAVKYHYMIGGMFV